jgi:hypothetical protein
MVRIILGSWIWIRIRIRVKSQVRIKVKIYELEWLKMEPGRAVDAHKEAWRLKMEPWRVCRTVVVDSQHFDEKRDPDRIGSGFALK